MDQSAILKQLEQEQIILSQDDKVHDAVVKPKSLSAEKIEGDSSEGEVVEYLYYDESEKTFAVESVQNVEPILEHAKDMSSLNGNMAGKNKAGDFYLAGSFPVVLVYAWLKKCGLDMRDFKGDIVKRFLNDSEHAAFRIWKGQV